MSTRRTHIVIPEPLVSDIDRLVGKHGRSEFLTKAHLACGATGWSSEAGLRQEGRTVGNNIPHTQQENTDGALPQVTLIPVPHGRHSFEMLRILLGAWISAGIVLAQPAGPPAFDVASVKPSPPGRERGNSPFGDNIQANPGSLIMRRVTLRACIAWAYRVFEYQVSGPEWTGTDRYDIAAKTAGPATDPDLRIMLQTLLADRFQLALHRQTREMQALILTVGKNGPKFHESKAEGGSSVQPDPKTMRLTIQRVPIATMIDPLARMFQMPVIDRTGLMGRYDVTLNVARYMPQNGEPVDPLSIIQTGLQEELGLKLEAKKTAVELLIVDHAEKAPSEN